MPTYDLDAAYAAPILSEPVTICLRGREHRLRTLTNRDAADLERMQIEQSRLVASLESGDATAADAYRGSLAESEAWILGLLEGEPLAADELTQTEAAAVVAVAAKTLSDAGAVASFVSAALATGAGAAPDAAPIPGLSAAGSSPAPAAGAPGPASSLPSARAASASPGARPGSGRPPTPS